MASIRGFIERWNGSQVGGWAVDSEAAEPVTVALYVGDVEIYEARADIHRADIERSVGAKFGGFNFRIGDKLGALLPHGSEISILADGGHPLRALKGLQLSVSNPECTSFDQLRERLASGWKVSSKSGELYRPLSELGERAEVLLDGMEYCRSLPKRELGHDLMIAYGTLLGAVREGDFIAHDDDIDAIFYVNTESTAEACLHFNRVVSHLKQLGERIRVIRSGQFHWFVPRCGNIDIFMGWFDRGVMYSYCAGGVEMSFDDVSAVPFRFRGRDTLVPAAYERVLESTYGAGWRTPDPLFQWRVAENVKLQMSEFQRLWALEAEVDPMLPSTLGTGVGTALPNAPEKAAERSLSGPPASVAGGASAYWDTFYRTWEFSVPSQFASLVATELQVPHVLLEIGCGNGRDAVFFARLGHTVLALDQSQEVVGRNSTREQQAAIGKLLFQSACAGERGVAAGAVEQLKQLESGAPICVYARFFFHAIDEAREAIILEELGQGLPSGSRCYFEFRSSRDADTPKVFGSSHYRRYIDLDEFIGRCSAVGLRTRYSVVGQGMAKFREEDPWVIRVILEKAG